MDQSSSDPPSRPNPGDRRSVHPFVPRTKGIFPGVCAGLWRALGPLSLRAAHFSWLLLENGMVFLLVVYLFLHSSHRHWLPCARQRAKQTQLNRLQMQPLGQRIGRHLTMVSAMQGPEPCPRPFQLCVLSSCLYLGTWLGGEDIYFPANTSRLCVCGGGGGECVEGRRLFPSLHPPIILRPHTQGEHRGSRHHFI